MTFLLNNFPIILDQLLDTLHVALSNSVPGKGQTQSRTSAIAKEIFHSPGKNESSGRSK